MAESFTIAASRCPEDVSLRGEIRSRTNSDEATSKILRCIERFRGDPSIVRFEVSPELTTRFAGARAVSWMVRAIRS